MAIDTQTHVEEEEMLLSLGLPGGFSIPVFVVQKQRDCRAQAQRSLPTALVLLYLHRFQSLLQLLLLWSV